MIPWWGFRAASDYLPKGPNCFSKNQWGLNCVMLLSCGPSVACYLDMVLTVSCYLDGLPISLFYFIGVPTASCYLIGVPTVECSLNGVPSVLCYRQGVPTVSWFPSFMLFFEYSFRQFVTRLHESAKQELFSSLKAKCWCTCVQSGYYVYTGALIGRDKPNTNPC